MITGGRGNTIGGRGTYTTGGGGAMMIGGCTGGTAITTASGVAAQLAFAAHSSLLVAEFAWQALTTTGETFSWPLPSLLKT